MRKIKTTRFVQLGEKMKKKNEELVEWLMILMALVVSIVVIMGSNVVFGFIVYFLIIGIYAMEKGLNGISRAINIHNRIELSKLDPLVNKPKVKRTKK